MGGRLSIPPKETTQKYRKEYRQEYDADCDPNDGADRQRCFAGRRGSRCHCERRSWGVAAGDESKRYVGVDEDSCKTFLHQNMPLMRGNEVLTLISVEIFIPDEDNGFRVSKYS